jgi:hypothetical protein
MILNNKSTNPLGYSISLETEEQKARIEQNRKNNRFDPNYQPPVLQVVVFPGVTGNHPRDMLKSPAFISDSQNTAPFEGIEIIDENSPVDTKRQGMNVSETVKIPDFDVVEFCTKELKKNPDEKDADFSKRVATHERKQINVLESIFKIPTLDEIKNRERRSNVIAAIDRQYKSITTSITKNTRAQ